MSYQFGPQYLSQLYLLANLLMLALTLQNNSDSLHQFVSLKSETYMGFLASLVTSDLRVETL